MQNLARQFQCHVNSPEFRDVLHRIWIPKLFEQIQANATATSNYTIKAQSDGPTYEPWHGLNDAHHNNSNNTPIHLGPTSLDQHEDGPTDLYSKPNELTDCCEAHVLPESGLSDDLDLDWEQIDEFLWEMTLNNDGDNMLFLEHQQD